MLSGARLPEDVSSETTACVLSRSNSSPWPVRPLATGLRFRVLTERTLALADDFRTTEVGDRYARALFDLALETGRLDAVRADLKSLRAAWVESADLRRLATSPIMSSADQGKGLVAVAQKAKFDATTINFLGLLAQNGRARDLGGVITGFEALYARHSGVVAAEVVSAQALTAAQLKSISTALTQALGKSPEVTTRVDPALLGGLKVKVGSKLFDASLKTRLDQLKFALKRA